MAYLKPRLRASSPEAVAGERKFDAAEPQTIWLFQKPYPCYARIRETVEPCYLAYDQKTFSADVWHRHSQLYG